MMTPTNGTDDDRGSRIQDGNANEMFSLEMESLHPGSTTVRRQTKPHNQFLSNLWLLIKLHIESHPKIFSTIGLIFLAFFMYIVVEWSKPPMVRHGMTSDYSTLQMHYDWQAMQMDHWCLFGGDNACPCEDFTEPIPRDEIKGWLEVHQANKKRWKKGIFYDVVFLGDDVIEEMNGTWLNLPAVPDGTTIKENFLKKFHIDDNGGNYDEDQMEGLALGIAGDSSSNLLWRIKHGEMPNDVESKVWWISIGSNDLARGGCSEDATVLGILHVAEEIANRQPYSRVVIQAILPRSMDPNDGSLSPHASSTASKFFGSKQKESEKSFEARKNMQLWPSIQMVNKQLRKFCKNHTSIIYVDLNSYFVGNVNTALYRSNFVEIAEDLMPNFDGRLSAQGHEILNQVVMDELNNIIRDENDANDIVNEKGEDIVDSETNEIMDGAGS